MPSLSQFALLSLSLGCAFVQTASDDDSDATMGPAAFMWPQDRPWDADVDNIAPCGSHAAVGNRTDYPLCKSSCRFYEFAFLSSAAVLIYAHS